ncbi:acyltransferase family protein [Rugamonas sp. CCM 8940]|uniref:acyltransferase family protein n=1 Tax=Rugamonas sp. CCM 8940 TaxID=2765359 RepID=UPI0018F46F4A|nr:acyltransferase [Rugamonas sp. CCM 8940]MBJ7312453.1 acyltransferase [Rugamonas sp. CCM 8940]
MAAAPGRHNNFNLIRLALALLVIVSHAPEMLDGDRSRELLSRLFHTLSFGELAVDGFFILSGYLILQSWLGRPQPLAFLQKRLLRIVPGYLLAALLSAFVVGALGAGGGYYGQFWWGGLARSLLLLDTPVTPATFVGSHYPSVNGAMWTIHYEFLCYLTVLALGLAGLLRWRHAPLAVLVLCLSLWGALALGAWPALAGAAREETLLMLRFYSCFFTGASYFSYRAVIVYSARGALLALAVLLAGLTQPASAEAGLLLGGAYLLFYCAFAAGGPLLRRTQDMPDASYGVYLYGWPVGKLLAWYLPTISPLALALATIALAYLCGRLSWHWVEQPALRFKSQAWNWRASASASATASVAASVAASAPALAAAQRKNDANADC